ncbi:MAG: hypothetical protein A2W25_03550 [candidate division Zixibacteria bacterium RBG_16_53_22]|nr:MAG: hypothetical protein A2W25_03550 [candidate division Zixibacteria bacterium RBG_16_53_22]
MLAALLKYRLLMMLGAVRGGGKIGKTLLFIFVFAMLAFALSSFAYGLLKFAELDPERGPRILENLVALSFHGMFLLLLFWGLSQAVFTIFFSDDLAILLSLPIPRRDIFIYKVLEATFLNARVSFLFLTPVLVVLGLHHGSSPGYYCIAALVTFLMATIPGALGIIIASLISNHVPRARLKGVITVVGSFIGIGMWAAMRQFSGQFSSGSADFGSEAMKTANIASWPIFSYLPSGWAYKATLGAASGDLPVALLYFLILVVLSVALTFVAFVSTARYYAGGIAEEVAAPSRVAIGGFAPGGSPLMAHVKRDMILFARESGVMTQSLVMMAFFLLYPFVGTSGHSDEISGLVISPVATLFAAFFGGQVGSRMLTLERLAFWRNLINPNGRQLTLASKLIVGLLFTTILALGAAMIHYVAKKPGDIDSVFLTILFSWIGFGVGLAICAFWGNFKWDHPKRMLKGGGGFIYAFSIMVVGLGGYGLTYLAYRYLSSLINPIMIVAVLSLGILSISYMVSALKLTNMEWTPDV